jgi:hypothetical protein
MNMDINSYSFWVVGAIWFTVPILSWLWSLASLFFYRRLTKLMKDATQAFEQAKSLNEQMLNYRLETLEIRTKAEEEIKLACKYYARVAELVNKEKEDKEKL